jgi:hypothetical protein
MNLDEACNFGLEAIIKLEQVLVVVALGVAVALLEAE